MNIAIFGATGWIGGTVTREALHRGHEVTAVVRDPGRLELEHSRLAVVIGDATDTDVIATVVSGHQAVAASIGGSREGNHSVVPAAAQALLAGLSQAGIKRLVWVGGAGSLEVAPGVRLIDTPQFPDDWKAGASAQVEALEVFRTYTGSVEWTYLSPAGRLEPGTRTGRYRTGGDRLLTDDEKQSRISVEDYAVAFIDELERPAHIRQRFTVAY